MASFFEEFFLNPLRDPVRYAPYNWVNTLVLAAVGLGGAYLLYRGLRRAGVELDERFLWAVAPFVLFGSSVRVLVDGGVLPRAVEAAGLTLFPFVTPGIYLVTSLLFLLSMVAARLLGGSWKSGRFAGDVQGFGIAFALVPFAAILMRARYPGEFLLSLGVPLLVAGGFEAYRRLSRRDTSHHERAVVFSQAFDGAATFVGVGLGVAGRQYAEEMVVSGAVSHHLGGPWGFLLLKVAFAVIAVELVRRELSKPEDAFQRNFILLLLAILGLAPALHDSLRMLLGV